MLLHQGIDFQTDQLVEAHVQDCCGLFLCKFQSFCCFFGGLGFKSDSFCNAICEAFFYLVTALAAAEDLNDQINNIASLDQTFLDLTLLLFLGKKGGVLSGIVEPIGAVFTILMANQIVPALPYLLSFAAGAMLYVVVEELIPEMSEGEHSNIGTLFFAVGFSVMMILDVALG